jgi:hypothetical protein
MAKSKRKSSTGLLSEAAKKAGHGLGDAARKAIGKKPLYRKSPTGNLSEAGKKAGRAVRKAVGKKSSRSR